MILAAFNIRGYKGKDQAVMSLLERAHVVGICETWMRPGDVNKKHVFQE